ncbi:MAG: hypothetical protein AAFZ15_07725 [Bacteroidota bacterium]
MSIIKKLTELYIEHATTTIEDGDGSLLLNKFGVPDHNSLIALDNYPESYRLVSDGAHLTDNLQSSATNDDELVLDCLRVQRKLIDNKEKPAIREVVGKLIKGRFYDKVWSDEQRGVYDQKSELLEWRDFFISYTNRDAPSTNQEFRSLVRSAFGKYPKLTDEQNWVPKVIHYLLRKRQGLLGFFDDQDLKIGEDIQKEVDNYCCKAFAFVQLVEPRVFDKIQGNWCYYEYQTFSDSPLISTLFGDEKNRHFFVLINNDVDDIIPAGNKSIYENTKWYKQMKSVKRMSIEGVKRHQDLRTESRQIANKIIELRNEIVEKWLDA